jgi:hypothetical protein
MCVYVSFQTTKQEVMGRNSRLIYCYYNWSILYDKQKEKLVWMHNEINKTKQFWETPVLVLLMEVIHEVYR